ncbi:MAG: hypothetical protein Q7R41_03485, partial [Phycisphaerales bacterium]|nr:hypothetical protein [Phycisphaerales bacterium]
MKTNLLICVSGTLALLVSATSISASAATSPPSPAPTATQTPIVLSPFEVSAEADEGYAARETLAGTRFKSELKDVPSQVSIMTKEFLDD